METQLHLSEKERALILEMLEIEARNLPSEIRRTEFNVQAEDDIHERQRTVNQLIQKIRGQQVQ